MAKIWREAAKSRLGPARQKGYFQVNTACMKKLTVFLVITCLASELTAQGRLADYQRAERLNAALQNTVLFAPEKIQWLPDGKSFSYLQNTARGKEFFRVNAATAEKKPLFDPVKLAASLGAAIGRTLSPYALPFTDFGFTDNGSGIETRIDSMVCACTLEDAGCRVLRKTGSRAPAGYWGDRDNESELRYVLSPDGKQQAFIREYNLYVSPAGKPEAATRYSFDGSEGEYYSNRIYWSPDGSHIAAAKIRANKPHLIYLVESSPVDQLQPKLHTRNYLKPGDALPQKTISIFEAGSKRQMTMDAAQIPEQYQVDRITWLDNSAAIRFDYNKRGHQRYSVFEMDTTGAVKELIREESNTFINYSGRYYRFDLSSGKEIIWASERDGWNHLYLYDNNGKVKNQITSGNWLVRRVLNVDEKARQIWFEGSGRESGMDPYFIQYYRVNFDGSGLTALTTENANHRAWFSPGYEWLVDQYSRLDMPPVTVLRDAQTGKIIQTIEKANIDKLLATGWQWPAVFTAPGRDGKTDIWGMIVFPSNYDPKKRYPVIEYIYAGPHDSFVPKSFVTDSRGSLHELAELGFIVVQCDGMGTANRSKAFHDVCWRNLKDAGFPDRMAWMKAAAKKYPSMDISRVGIFGNSAGGQSSMGALLFHPAFYKVAVSSSGCHDNRMDKMWWNEQWMGYPIGEQYAASSNVTHAGNLQGKVLLILGELDDNVDPSSTMQLINALVKNNKEFDFLYVPGMGHSLGGDYGEHKRRDFFVRHLLGMEPPAWGWKQVVGTPKP